MWSMQPKHSKNIVLLETTVQLQWGYISGLIQEETAKNIIEKLAPF